MASRAPVTGSEAGPPPTPHPAGLTWCRGRAAQGRVSEQRGASCSRGPRIERQNQQTPKPALRAPLFPWNAHTHLNPAPRNTEGPRPESRLAQTLLFLSEDARKTHSKDPNQQTNQPAPRRRRPKPAGTAPPARGASPCHVNSGAPDCYSVEF